MALIPTERVHPGPECDQLQGVIRVDWPKLLWLMGHATGGLIGLLFFAQLDAFIVFLVLTSITICAGHSVGMHRLLIHRSFETPLWVERLLVWLGVLVGMAGPFGMIRAHDMRDWHQRQSICPPHPSHGAGSWRDAWWQLCCRYDLRNPPVFVFEDSIQNDRFYQAVERSWMLQQVPVALVLYALGGWAWVLWGICLRVFVSLSGHWMVGHFAHHKGAQEWVIEGLPVQGYNLPGFGLITFGENWHGNHHAFPHSAKLGVLPGQFDPGFIFIRTLQWLGLASHIKLPHTEPKRAGLKRLNTAEPINKEYCDSVPPYRPDLSIPQQVSNDP